MREGAITKKLKNWSGHIWGRPAAQRAWTVRLVCEILKEEYGKLRLGNPDDPLDDLIYVILSNRIAPGVARRIYEDLKGRFDTWDELLTASSVFETIELLKFAGLAAVKSQQIWAALEKIRRDFGSCDLSQLYALPQEKAEEYLTSLPGVSLKVAKCVMMYTLNAEVLPVDSHVHRVTKRLGWNDRKRADQCHEELEALVVPDIRYALHVACIAHGRAVCRPAKPVCEQCCVSQYCTYYSHAA